MRMLGPIALVVLAQGLAGCGGSRSSPVPAAPSPVPDASPIQLTTVAPNVGSTGGSTPVTITGTGFQSGATATIDGTVLRSVYVRNSTTIHFTAPPHPAATVDVVVTNPSGQGDKLAGAYTYVSPESFDFNGTWVGGAGSEYDTEIRFTIQNNALASVSCGTSGNVTFSPPPSVRNGEFSFVGHDGLGISGRIVSAVNAVGTINVGPCTSIIWLTTKQ